MKLGIVGLPNVGKSTLFNAITSTKNAAAANYPFCTIDPNTGIVPVPDARLDKLAEIWDTNKKTPAIVEFVDIAGLVKGASQGEGLGKKHFTHGYSPVVRGPDEGTDVPIRSRIDSPITHYIRRVQTERAFRAGCAGQSKAFLQCLYAAQAQN